MDFKRDTALFIQHGGVQRLVHIRLRGGDVVLKSLWNRGKLVVHDAQHRVTLIAGVHDDTDSIYVVDFVEVSALHIHLAVDTVEALYPALQKELHALFVQSFPYLFLNGIQKTLPLLLFELEHPLNLLIGNRVQKAQRDVLQLLLDGADTQTVRQRSIDLHCFQCFFSALILLPVFTGAHIVQAVRQLYDDNPHILCHRQQHLAHIFRLTLFLTGIAELGQLGNAVHHQRNICTKHLFDFIQCGSSVLHHVMQKTCTDGFGVHSQLHQDMRN